MNITLLILLTRAKCMQTMVTRGKFHACLEKCSEDRERDLPMKNILRDFSFQKKKISTDPGFLATTIHVMMILI